MKKILILISFWFITFVSLQVSADAPQFIIDSAKDQLLNDLEKEKLNENLANIYKRFDQKIIVLFVLDPNGDAHYSTKAYRELDLSKKDFLIIFRKDIMNQKYWFDIEFDRYFYPQIEFAQSVADIRDFIRDCFNQGQVYQSINLSCEILIDLSQGKPVGEKVQRAYARLQRVAHKGEGNSTALIIGIVFLIFLRIITWSNQAIKEVRVKKPKQADYDIFYSRQFSSSKVVSFFLIVARVLRFAAGGKSFHGYQGGTSGGGGAGGQW